MPIDTFILFLFTTAVVVFSPGAAAIAVASQGATNGGRRALAGVCGIWMSDSSVSLILEFERR